MPVLADVRQIAPPFAGAYRWLPPFPSVFLFLPQFLLHLLHLLVADRSSPTYTIRALREHSSSTSDQSDIRPKIVQSRISDWSLVVIVNIVHLCEYFFALFLDLCYDILSESKIVENRRLPRFQLQHAPASDDTYSSPNAP